MRNYDESAFCRSMVSCSVATSQLSSCQLNIRNYSAAVKRARNARNLSGRARAPGDRSRQETVSTADIESTLELDTNLRVVGSFTLPERAPTRAFSWLKVPTSAFTFKTLLRHYAKRALIPLSLNVKLGPRRKGHKGRAGCLA